MEGQVVLHRYGEIKFGIVAVVEKHYVTVIFESANRTYAKRLLRRSVLGEVELNTLKKEGIS